MKADAVAAGTQSAEEVPAWGAELLELSEACGRGVQYACNALSYEDEAKRAWQANQGEEHLHDAPGGGASASRGASSAAGGGGDAAGGGGDAAGDAAFEAMGASLVDDLEAAFEEMSAALVDDLQRAFD